MAMPAQEAMKPWLELASEQATKLWLEDLESLCLDAKHRFPDLVWSTKAELGDSDIKNASRKIWGHLAIVFAREPPLFAPRYLTQSSELNPDSHGEKSVPTFLPKDSCDYKTLSDDLLQLYTPTSSKIEDENGVNNSTQQERLDSLRKDVVFMWRSRLYSDVRIALPSGTSADDQLYLFPSHRFLLSSRSPYFHRALTSPSRRRPNSSNEPSVIQLTLPGKHFTVASLHFILGYLYTGTLKFSHRGFDLATALSIFSGSLYLELPALQELILAEITVEMLHGMYHAFLPDPEYSSLVSGNWATAVSLGCQCRICARRAPRVLQFALEEGNNNDLLERGARRALVGLFGEGWCIEEFSALPDNTTGLILADIREMMTASNVLPLLFAAELALIRLEDRQKDWGPIVESSILSVRRLIDKALCANAGTCFESQTWRHLTDGSKKNVGENAFEKVTWVLGAVLRGANPENASALYQALGSSAPSHSRPFSIWARVRRAQAELQKLDLTASSIQRLKLGETDSLLSSAASFYSCISTPSRIASLSEEQANIAGYNPYLSALDLATVSLYSLASSRTVTTDYGLYYTRWAVSQETIQDSESIRAITRRRSWDSFRN
ncbi:hypothetical protein GALMADRAFT_146638 [Galerina marginata CBS 339.88]|uniref:BTB domain-containing protein n=1 Tax=Galerina marginata (strain CBS 339.88) TaxID=685588 RepID=A0A067SBB1_GALM3|nr:hypothetical protein GALMADRAFT_146638 [Galerina marginata CBS 339.88]